MNDVTRILSAIAQDGPTAAERLLPLVYDELRKLAAHRLSHERPGHTLQPTALVHEAFLRLVGPEDAKRWDHRGHFFAAAAGAMRRILVEAARRKLSLKHGGRRVRAAVEPDELAAPDRPDRLIAVDEALAGLAEADPRAAELVKLRYFAGLPVAEAATVLGISTRSAERLWTYARAWLRRAIGTAMHGDDFGAQSGVGG